MNITTHDEDRLIYQECMLDSCKGCSDDRYGRCLIASGPTLETSETAETAEEQEAREWYETHDKMI